MNLQLHHNHLKQLLHVCCLAIVALFVAYVYFLSASVVHVVIREDVDQSTQKVRSSIASLESEYIAAQHMASMKITSFDGYDEVSEKTFIDRSAPALVMNN